MWYERIKGAIFGVSIIFIIFILLSMNISAPVNQGPNARLDCTYDTEEDKLQISVTEGQFEQARTAALWVVGQGGPVEIKRGSKAANGVWVHDADVADLADLPLGTDAQFVVPDVSEPEDITVLWVAQKDGNVHIVLNAGDGSRGNCDTGEV
jgi:hypothetical protein